MNSVKYKYTENVHWENPVGYHGTETKRIKSFKKSNRSKTGLKIFFNNNLTGKKYSFSNDNKKKINNFLPITAAIIFISAVIAVFGISAAGSKTENLNSLVFMEKDDGTKMLEDFLFFKDAESDDRPVIPSSLKKIEYSRYRVQKSDSIEKISNKFGITMDTLALANNIKTYQPLKTGSFLSIPNQNGRSITIKSNESVLGIAKYYGTSWERISDTNNLTSSVIHPGQKLFIPDSQMTKYEKDQFLVQQFIWPIRGRISSYFGSRIDPFTGIYSFHTGLDIRNNEGTPVKCVKDGKVVYTGFHNVLGNFVIVKHSGGIMTVYGHLNKYIVEKGTELKQGQFLGYVGSTGRSTGPHLHFEVTKNGNYMNPLEYLRI